MLGETPLQRLKMTKINEQFEYQKRNNCFAETGKKILPERRERCFRAFAILHLLPEKTPKKSPKTFKSRDARKSVQFSTPHTKQPAQGEPPLSSIDFVFCFSCSSSSID